MNYKKLSSIIYALLIVLSIVAPITFVGNVARATITNRPVLYFYNGTADVTGDPVQVPAILSSGQYLAIDMSAMTITGAQIWIWFSKTGGATIEPPDAVFIGPIYVGDLISSTPTSVQVPVYAPFNKVLGDHITVNVGNNWVNITALPGLFEAGVLYWIKVTDVDPRFRATIPSSDVAVSTNRIEFVSAFYAYTEVNTGDGEAVPDEPVTAGGYATPIGEKYNVTLDYLTISGELVATVTTQLYTEPATNINPEWNWTGFEVTFKAPDLELRCPDTAEPFDVNIINATSGATYATFTFQQPVRTTFINFVEYAHGYDYSGTLTLETGHEYNVTVINFPYKGSIEISLNGTYTMASNVALNETGGIDYITVTVPYVPHSGVYNFTVKDNHGVIYWFLVYVEIVPFIEVVPEEGYVGDVVLVYGYYFNDYVGDRINIWFQINSTPYYVLVANFTVPAVNWVVNIVVPHASCDNKVVVATTDLAGTSSPTDTIPAGSIIDSTTFKVLPKIVVEPSIFPNDGRSVAAIGTGFCEYYIYTVTIDNHYLITTAANGTGDLYVEFVAAGFTPGLHAIALYPYKDYYGVVNRMPEFVAFFNVTGTTLEDVMAKLDEIESMLSDMSGTLLVIKDNVAYLVSETQSISLSIDDLKVMITQLGDNIELKLSDVNNSLAQLIIKKGDEIVGRICTKLSDLDAKITDVSNNVVTISTKLGDVKTTIDDLKNGQAEIKDLIKTKSGDIVAVIDTAKGDILAELSTVEDLIKNGVKVDTENILAKIDELKSSVGTVSDKLDALAASLDNVKSSLDDIKSSVSAVKSSVEDVKSSVSSAISSAVDDLKTTIEDKANSVSGSVSTYGLVNLILILIAIILTAYVGFFHKKE